MSVPFWIHCNVCIEPFTPQLKLFMLNCSHTVCKNCLRCNSDEAFCPLCKKKVKATEVTKVTDDLKSYFHPNIETSVNKPIQKMSFQRTHQTILFKHTRNAKYQHKKAFQVKAQLEQELLKMRNKCNEMEKRRKAMQSKLKEVFHKNRQKKEMMHRNSMNYTPSSVSLHSRSISNHSSSHSASRSHSNLFGNSTGSTGFFHKNAPMLSQHHTISNIMMTPNDRAASPRSNTSRNSFNSMFSDRTNKSSQSNRKPFFA